MNHTTKTFLVFTNSIWTWKKFCKVKYCIFTQFNQKLFWRLKVLFFIYEKLKDYETSVTSRKTFQRKNPLVSNSLNVLQINIICHSWTDNKSNENVLYMFTIYIYSHNSRIDLQIYLSENSPWNIYNRENIYKYRLYIIHIYIPTSIHHCCQFPLFAVINGQVEPHLLPYTNA